MARTCFHQDQEFKFVEGTRILNMNCVCVTCILNMIYVCVTCILNMV